MIIPLSKSTRKEQDSIFIEKQKKSTKHRILGCVTASDSEEVKTDNVNKLKIYTLVCF